MNDRELILALNKIDLNEFADIQLKNGILFISDEFRNFWTQKYKLAKDITSDVRRPLLLRKMGDFLKDITFAIGTSSGGVKPNYYQYTNAHILDWFITFDTATFIEIKKRALKGNYYLLNDLLKFESSTVEGFEQNHTLEISLPDIRKRIEYIKEAIQLINQISKVYNNFSFNKNTPTIRLKNIEEYIEQKNKLSGLINFTCFPLTKFHDEILFIRILHCSELCFLGIRTCLISAIENLKQSNIQEAANELKIAIEFTILLHKHLKILKTMPIKHFASFRDDTGKASALQSINYHLMDIYFRGVNTDKAEHYNRIQHLRSLLRYAHPKFTSLKQSLEILFKNKTTGINIIEENARELDKQLLTWRGLHLSFAKKYIPHDKPYGTGGTEGAPYLKKHLKTGLFDETEPDMAVIKEIFPDDTSIPDEFRIIPKIGIAPRDNLRNKDVYIR